MKLVDTSPRPDWMTTYFFSKGRNDWCSVAAGILTISNPVTKIFLKKMQVTDLQALLLAPEWSSGVPEGGRAYESI
jgi:hypothetical protein